MTLKIRIYLLLIMTSLILVGCRNNSADEKERIPETTSQSDSIVEQDESTNEDAIKYIEINIEDLTYEAVLQDNASVKEFINQLPMTVTMKELNGNEKYFYLEKGITKNSSKIDKIHTGDLMLFGSDCLVLFYEDFTTSYSYTPLGYVENPDSLKDALKNGNVNVSFRKKEQQSIYIKYSTMRKCTTKIFCLLGKNLIDYMVSKVFSDYFLILLIILFFTYVVCKFFFYIDIETDKYED